MNKKNCTKRANVLLLNPPGKRTYIRDYSCSKISQADYVYHPVDLLMVSAILSPHYDVEVIDAIAGKISISKTIEEISRINPSAVVVLVGAVSWKEDIAFIRLIRKQIKCLKIIGIGDVFAEKPEEFLSKYQAIDAVLLNFTTNDIVQYLAGDLSSVKNMVIRDEQGRPTRTPTNTMRQFDIPVPLHDRFFKYKYYHPFIRGKKFATVLLDYGCPFRCSFCIMESMSYRTRSIESIKHELLYLHRIGICDILFITQTFGADKKLAHEVCNFMAEGGFNFKWICFSRVDIATPTMLAAMQRAGCHTIIFGVESGSEMILKKYRKDYTVPQVLSTIEYCHSHGIETVGTFILGLPEETYDTMKETLDLLRRIKLDYASFNVAVPRAGTGLRQEAITEGLIKDDVVVMDQSGTEIAMPTKSLSREDIRRYRRKAVLTFYGRPKYLIGRICKAQTFGHLLRQSKQAIKLLRNSFTLGERS